jgi:DNA-binding response OmpR family regulator
VDKPTTILLIEGDPNIAVPLVFGLQDEGFRVLLAADGHWGLKLARAAQPDMVLLDVTLSRMDGFAVCRTLRSESAVPIILLTAHGRKLDQVRGLESGADGCLVKPFSFRELLARMRALLRRRDLDQGRLPLRGDRIVTNGIVLERTTRQVWHAGRLVKLRHREFDLLCVLMENAGKAVPRHELLNKVWGEDWIGDSRTLDVHICWLRQKLRDDPTKPRYIQTLRGYGYRFVDPATSSSGVSWPRANGQRIGSTSR